MASQPGSRYQDKPSQRWFLADPADRTSNSAQEIASKQGKPNRDSLKVTSSKLSTDGHTVFLAIEGMQPVHQMKITWDLDSKDGRGVRGELHNSIHALQKDPGFPKAR